MGLSPYQSPSDAGVLCVLLVNTAMSIAIMKEIVCSILHVIGIHVASGEDYSTQTLAESLECRGTPSETYMGEFRSRTPSMLYDSLCCQTKEECSVCLVEFKLDAEINRLSCGHVFHRLCLEKWLKLWNNVLWFPVLCAPEKLLALIFMVSTVNYGLVSAEFKPVKRAGWGE
ncbi:hypothetical protein E3N88_27627 [Mikania micrantha]|uniref:RING-type domain-containing protein n=1 Tax=Mikania micrantha TaxID=192012 RepID=A0A5N6MY71_9ASTR|nr:hypothetical protein E3N88_27627 [Mikania micrantha]